MSITSSLNNFIITLRKFDMVDYNTRNNHNKVEFLTSIYNISNDCSIVPNDFISALDEYFTFNYEINDEHEFFSENISDDAYLLSDKIETIIEEESNRFIESSALESISSEKVDKNIWNLTIVLRNKHKFQEEFTVNIRMTKQNKNNYQVLITSWDRTD